MTAYAEVIGDPIEQSLSPLIHKFWLEKAGIAGDYRRRRVGTGELAAYLVERRPDPDWRGCNVTMPLKLDAIAAADEATDRAIAAGAANLLMPKDGRIIAANTDVGAVSLLVDQLRKAGHPARGVTLLGNGGAARAALVGLKLLGITMVRIQARDMAAATRLAVEFGLETAPLPFTHPIEGDGLINATPLGMADRDCLNCDVAAMTSQGWVFDMVSTPEDTALVRAARARGLAVITGTDMLIEQADSSFRLFFGSPPPREFDGALRQRLGRQGDQA